MACIRFVVSGVFDLYFRTAHLPDLKLSEDETHRMLARIYGGSTRQDVFRGYSQVLQIPDDENAVSVLAILQEASRKYSTVMEEALHLARDKSTRDMLRTRIRSAQSVCDRLEKLMYDRGRRRTR